MVEIPHLNDKVWFTFFAGPSRCGTLTPSAPVVVGRGCIRSGDPGRDAPVSPVGRDAMSPRPRSARLPRVVVAGGLRGFGAHGIGAS